MNSFNFVECKNESFLRIDQIVEFLIIDEFIYITLLPAGDRLCLMEFPLGMYDAHERKIFLRCAIDYLAKVEGHASHVSLKEFVYQLFNKEKDF